MMSYDYGEPQELSFAAKLASGFALMAFAAGFRYLVFEGTLTSQGWVIVGVIALAEAGMAFGAVYVTTLIVQKLLAFWWVIGRQKDVEAPQSAPKAVPGVDYIETPDEPSEVVDVDPTAVAHLRDMSAADLAWYMAYDEHTNTYRTATAKLRLGDFDPNLLREFADAALDGAFAMKSITKTNVSDVVPGFNRVSHGDQIEAFITWLTRYKLIENGDFTDSGYRTFLGRKPQTTPPHQSPQRAS